jgi:hypothetical protein
MNLTKCGASVVLLAALIGCDEEEPAAIAGGPGVPVPGVGARDAAADGSADGGGDGGMPVSTVGPVVSLRGLLASSDPVTGPVLTGASVDVTCEVKARSSDTPVDPARVMVAIYAGTQSTAVATVPGTLQDTDTYKASVPLSAVPTGPVRFRCSALDKSSTPLMGFAELQTFYDAGPTIEFTNLNEMSVVARGKDSNVDLTVQFKVDPARLSDGDQGADVAKVELSISETVVPIDPPVGNAYSKGIDFYTFFNQVPVASVTVAVTATNKRGGASATAKKQLIVKVDGEPPKVVITTPSVENPIVGGTVEMIMSVTDDLAGLAAGQDKLYAQILNDNTRTYPLIAKGNGVYGFTFEALQYSSTSNIEAQINVIDKAGNATVKSFPMRLDTVPPWISLVPENVRVVSSAPVMCSGSFDPLGLSPTDGEVILQDARFRAMVWERGIKIPGNKAIPVAGVQSDSVKLYAQRNASIPLLINQSGDKTGLCDAINAEQVLQADAPYVKAFAPVVTGGNLKASSPTTGGANDLSSDPPLPSGFICNPTAGETAPLDKCTNSELSYVISESRLEDGVAPTAIYAATPTANGLNCTGASFDIKGEGGWTCVAVEVRDRAGNHGISKPIRVCRKIKSSDCEEKAAGEILQPPASLTCTDGCTIPALYTEQPEGSRLLLY